MARILCNVAGGGKPLKGNAETGDVLAGKTFSNKQSNALTGSMPNNGALNITLTPSGNNSTSQAVAAGYYSGGTITANGSSSYNSGYANGFNQGVTDKRNDLTGNRQYVSLSNPADSGQCQWDVQGKAGYSGIIFSATDIHYWTWEQDGGSHGQDSSFPASYNSSTGIVHIGPCWRCTTVKGYIYYY